MDNLDQLKIFLIYGKMLHNKEFNLNKFLMDINYGEQILKINFIILTMLNLLMLIKEH